MMFSFSLASLSMRVLGVLVFLLSCQLENGFYVPGVAPVEFRKSDTIEVKV